MKGALNKIPKLRPTYAMLLRHAWLASFLKPPTISEEEEEVTVSVVDDATLSDVIDKEVSLWVLSAMESKRNGTMGKRTKPALHAAPLDAVSSPES